MMGGLLSAVSVLGLKSAGLLRQLASNPQDGELLVDFTEQTAG
jgi:hypothetical protein